MKNLILISLISVLFPFHLLAGDTYKVRTEVFKLEVTKVLDIVPYKILTTSDKSLKLTGKTSEIIDYLYPDEMESELDFDQMYKLTVESSQDIEDIKKDILFHFLKGVGLKIDFISHQQTNFIISYPTDLSACEALKEDSENASVRLNIEMKRRVLLRGYGLDTYVKSMNKSVGIDIFEAGQSGLVALPKMYIARSKLQKEPVNYLKSKGFEVEEVERVVETPILVYAE